ncbi:MAG: PAS domain S-box protein [Candidatus Helarchaeota archaeon]|nr:PAS domain S-box protein [Candidatus Helarchaeota archaeon]
MGNNKLKDKIELLEVKLKHLENDYFLAKEENEVSSGKYLEILSEQTKNNKKLQQEIAERKKTEKELRKSKQLIEKTFNSLNDAIFILNATTPPIAIDCNHAALEMFGYRREEIFENTPEFLFISDSSFEEFKKHLYPAVVRKGFFSHFEFEMKRKNGTIFPTENFIIPLKDELGNQTGWVSVIRDITERKQMEQMLIQSEKMASIGTLAAGVAHEINNPIGYIYNNLKILLKYNEKNKNFYTNIQELIEEHTKEKIIIEKFMKLKEDADIDYLFNDISSATEESIEGAEKVIKIVSDLKSFARKEKPKMEIADINKGIEKTLNIVWNELKYKSEVVKEFGDILEIECDIKRLEQVFVNILVNAVQAIENRGVIKIKTFTKNNFIVIRISDTGKGIPKENVGKIFDAFYTTKEPGKGTGLGLSISYKIIQEHDGTIDVESEVGKGTTFTIKLPVKKPD